MSKQKVPNKVLLKLGWFQLDQNILSARRLSIQPNLCTLTNIENQNSDLCWTGGRCSEVICAMKSKIVSSKYWPLLTGGR
jgi:hypothetical protein